MRTRKMFPFVAVAVLIACPMMRSQTPGACAGMRPAQLTSLNGFIPFQGTGSLWNTDISYALLDPNSTKILKLLGGPAS
jgi:hypothetical protein